MAVVKSQEELPFGGSFFLRSIHFPIELPSRCMKTRILAFPIACLEFAYDSTTNIRM